jgi:osmotically-inducible protein OsmY
MKTLRPTQALAAAVTAVAMLAGTGCAVVRDQQSVGTYIDDSVLTTRVKAKFAENPTVSAMALSVETFQGVVQLSGMAKSTDERTLAESLARSTSGVRGVRNDIRVSG